MRLVGHIAHMGKKCVRMPQGKRPLGRPRCRLEDNIKMNCTEIWCEDVYWDQLAQDEVHWRILLNTFGSHISKLLDQ